MNILHITNNMKNIDKEIFCIYTINNDINKILERCYNAFDYILVDNSFTYLNMPEYTNVFNINSINQISVFKNKMKDAQYELNNVDGVFRCMEGKSYDSIFNELYENGILITNTLAGLNTCTKIKKFINLNIVNEFNVIVPNNLYKKYQTLNMIFSNVLDTVTIQSILDNSSLNDFHLLSINRPS